MLDTVYLGNVCYDVIKGTQCSMLNTVTVNNERRVVGVTDTVWWYTTQTIK